MSGYMRYRLAGDLVLEHWPSSQDLIETAMKRPTRFGERTVAFPFVALIGLFQSMAAAAFSLEH
jgi:hypothetical protein